MSLAYHSEDDHTKVCESVGNLAMSEEGEHAEVRAIVDKGLLQLMQWLDLRLQQQEDNLRSLIIAQDHQRSRANVKKEPQEASKEQAFKPDIEHFTPRSAVRGVPSQCSRQSVSQSTAPGCEGRREWYSFSSTRADSKTLSLDEGHVWITSLMDIFDQLDLDGTGSIDLSEFEMAVKETGLSDVNSLAVFSHMDKSKNGTIDRSEWLQMVSQSARGSDNDMNLIKDFLSQLVHLQDSRGNIYESNKADRARRAKMILRHDALFRVTWDVMLMLLLFYVAVSLPFQLGFGWSEALAELDLAVDIVFCCDVALNFRTSYPGNDGTIVIDWKKIGTRYLKSWFVLDFVASVPFDVITTGLLPKLTPARLLKIGKIAKVLKILRITKIARRRSDSEWVERLKIRLSSAPCVRFLRISKLLCIAFLVAHWLACFNSAVDNSAFDEYFNDLGLGPTVLQKYLAGMYWSMTTISTVGYGDITPNTDRERAFAMLAMVVGGALYGFVVGSITSIVTDMDIHVHEYKERMQIIQSWLDRHKRIPLLMRRKLRKHFKRLLHEKTVIGDDSVIGQLSGELRGDVASFVINQHVQFHPMVVNLTKSALAELVYILQETEAARHELVVQIADPGIGMYFLVQGLARYAEGSKWQPPGAKDEHTSFQHIMPGEGFGEEIIFGLAETYAYTVITVVDCKFNWIDENSFREHFRSFPQLRNQMYAAIVHTSVSSKANTTSSNENEKHHHWSL